MITFSIIRKSQLEGAHRLDAEYYQPEYLELVETLNNLGAVPIRDVAKNPKRKFKPQEGKIFQYIEISEVDLSTGEYNKREILGEDAPDRAQWVVKQNDVITSTVRPVRSATSLIREDTQNLVCSSGFAVLKSEKIEPEYLFVYLKSRPIVKLLDRKTTATMYPAVTIDDILNTKIYLGDKKVREEIKSKIIESQKELEKAQNLYSQAENLLLEELGLKDFEVEDDLSYIVNLSEVKSAHRADAEYFQPKYDKLIQVAAKKFDISELKQVFNFKRGIFISTNYYSEEKTSRPYIRIKELSGGRSSIDESKVIFINDQYSEDKNNVLKENDLVIAIIGDTIGKVNGISKELANGFCSNNMGRVRIKSEWSSKIISEFSEVLFQSIFIQSQIERKKAQTGQPKIGDNEIKSIKIPILPKSTQQKIADLVQQSHEARSKAKQLLEQAKNKVENLIEVKS